MNESRSGPQTRFERSSGPDLAQETDIPVKGLASGLVWSWSQCDQLHEIVVAPIHEPLIQLGEDTQPNIAEPCH
jgi:hypothetical protein